ncbi:hypothetical protein J3F84DRAFT_357137 [Trichoderma pleuroticola]
MVLTGPPLHQEWAPSSNQASAGQSHNYRPRQQVLCARYRSRDTTTSTYHPPPARHRRGPAPHSQSSSDSYLHPWGPEAQRTGLAKCLAKTDLAAGRADASAGPRRGGQPQCFYGGAFPHAPKRRRPGTFSQSWGVKISRDADEQHLRL